MEERAATAYDEEATLEHLARIGRSAEHAHAHAAAAAAAGPRGGSEEARPAETPDAAARDHDHAHDHAHAMHMGGCPGSRSRVLRPRPATGGAGIGRIESRLGQWPVQIALVPPTAPYFQGADVLVAADCVAFAYGEFHRDFLDGKALMIGCPKLDDIDFYRDKLTRIFTLSDVRSVTVAMMEVPCCTGLMHAVVDAVRASGKPLPVSAVTIGIAGEILDTEAVTVEPVRSARPAAAAGRP